ncbi:MAG: hypothetical protein LBG80_04625 [Bacteroidales bacterium]|jgi:hypothetical protein|nr:hypothetical protein [Bacteroidales bacterium]
MKMLKCFFYVAIAATIVACSKEEQAKVLVDCEIIVDGVSTRVTSTAAGTVTGGGLYDFGQECTVTATPNDGYELVSFEDDKNKKKNQSSYTFDVPGEDMKFTAKFRSVITIDIQDVTNYAHPYNDRHRDMFFTKIKRTLTTSVSPVTLKVVGNKKYEFWTEEWYYRSTTTTEETKTFNANTTTEWDDDYYDETYIDYMGGYSEGESIEYEWKTYTLTVGNVIIINAKQFPIISEELIINGTKYIITYSRN